MSLGTDFLLACCKHVDLAEFAKHEPMLFDGGEEVAMLRLIKDYIRTSGELPKAGLLLKKFPDADLPSGKPSYYREELVKRHIYTALTDTLPSELRRLKDDPIKGLESIRKVVADLRPGKGGTDKLFHERATSRFDSYVERVTHGGITYMSLGEDVWDNVMLGLTKTDLVTIGGRPGMGKTWLLAHLALCAEAALPKDMGPVLFVSNEIGVAELEERFDCLYFNLGYDRLLRGKLTKEERSRYTKGLKTLEDTKSRIITLFNCKTVEEIEYKIRMYAPSAVFIDGSYLMYPTMEEGIGKTSYITRNLKATSLDTQVPILNTTQLRKKSGRKSTSVHDGQDEFFYGAYIQDSDVAVRMYQDVDMVYAGTVGLDFVKGRRMKPGVKLLWKTDVEESENTFVDVTDIREDGTPVEDSVDY